MIRNAEIPGECVTDETLTDYLDGALDPVVKAASEVHLIACDRCRSKLAFFMRLLKEALEPQEQVALATIQEDWQRAQIARRVPPPRVGLRQRWMLTLVGLAAVLILAVGVREMVDRMSEPRSGTEVVQLLLGRYRPFEGRMSSQAAVPFVSTRGPEVSETDNASLLAPQMSRLSATSSEMGQFYLLQRQFERAIGYLQPAAQESGATPGIHNDLGVAYLESGKLENLQKAAKEFRQALVEKPDFAPAYFNLALFYEQTRDAEQERSALSQFLKVETDPAWLNEAHTKLEGIRN